MAGLDHPPHSAEEQRVPGDHDQPVQLPALPAEPTQLQQQQQQPQQQAAALCPHQQAPPELWQEAGHPPTQVGGL